MVKVMPYTQVSTSSNEHGHHLDKRPLKISFCHNQSEACVFNKAMFSKFYKDFNTNALYKFS